MRKTLSRLDRRQFIALGGGAATAFAMPSLAKANSWPTKPLRILAGSAAGGQTDLFSRIYGEYISREIGQPVVVENKSGAGGAIAAVELKRSEPDGHTLMIANTTAYMLNPVLIKDVRYDVAKDFSIVSMMPTGSLVVMASAKTGARTLQEFVEYARKTEKVNVGTYAAGSYAHIVISELNKQYGLKMEAVHYRGEAPMWSDLAGQSLDAGIGSYGAASPLLHAEKAHAIAVSRRRISTLPEVQTLQEQGATSRAHTLLTFQACAVPINTPASITAKLSELFVKAGNTDRIREILKSQGVDEAAMPKDASQAIYKEEAPIWAELALGLGLQPQ
jgi:tripartite-type tricarboxylate transporter receptor subunit TctC